MSPRLRLQRVLARAERSPRIRALGAGLLASWLYGLACPPFDLWPMVFLAPLPLLWLASRPVLTPSRAGLYAGLGCWPWVWFTHHWIGSISAAGLLPLVALLSVYPMLFVWLMARLWERRRGLPAVLLAPALWAGLEFLRANLAFDGYAWYLLGHPLIEGPALVFTWPARYAGAIGPSALVALAAALAFDAARRVRPWQAAVLALLAAWPIAGLAHFARAPMPTEGSLRIAVVQSNIPQSNRFDWTTRQRVADFLRLRDLTVGAASADPEVIVWPEGMFPGRTLDGVSLEAERDAGAVWPLDPAGPDDEPGLDAMLGGMSDGVVPDAIASTDLADTLGAIQRALGVPMLVGAAGFDGFRGRRDDGRIAWEYDAIYNSAFVLAGGVVAAERYDKLQLAPFGEVMPYISAWPWLERRLLAFGAHGMSFVLSPGSAPTLLTIPIAEGRGVPVATPICFEATVPWVCRELVFDASGRRRSGVMITITNDGWFGGWTPGRRQYIQASRWRSVELATPMVRAANTGISCVVRADGSISPERAGPIGGGPVSRPDNFAGVLRVDLPLAAGTTVYAQRGEWLGWMLLVCAAGWAALALWPVRRAPAAGAADEHGIRRA